MRRREHGGPRLCSTPTASRTKTLGTERVVRNLADALLGGPNPLRWGSFRRGESIGRRNSTLPRRAPPGGFQTKTLPGILAIQSAQVGMFDAAVVMGPLPEGSFVALLAEHGDRIVRDEDFAECYSSGMGRPSIPPSLLAKVLLLQHRTGVSDEEAMECVVWDLRWKVALGLAVDHQGWHPTSLTKFRARLLLRKKEALALENTLLLAGELGMQHHAHLYADNGASRLVLVSRRCSGEDEAAGSPIVGMHCLQLARFGKITPNSAARPKLGPVSKPTTRWVACRKFSR